MNFQQIPSHAKEIRKMFVAKTEEKEIEPINDEYTVKEFTEVETTDGFKYAGQLTVDDKLVVDDNSILSIKNIEVHDTDIIIKV